MSNARSGRMAATIKNNLRERNEDSGTGETPVPLGLRKPSAGGLERFKFSGVRYPNGEGEPAGDGFRVVINNEVSFQAVGLSHERPSDERERREIMLQMAAGVFAGFHIRAEIAGQNGGGDFIIAFALVKR